MNKKGTQISILALLFIVLFSCSPKTKQKQLLLQIKEVREQYAPDKRTALFDVHVFTDATKYILKGETDKPEAVSALGERLERANISFISEIKELPSKSLGGKTWGVITNSVANLRSNPKHSAELATQATLGTPVRVLKQDGGWYYIQTPDKYLSWVDDGGVVLMNKKEMEQWRVSNKIIFTKTYGHAFNDFEEKSIVSDLVAGDVLVLLAETEKYYQVRFPDGREAYIRKEEALNYDEWLNSLNPTPERLVSTSKTLMGVPYLWGGTSSKGVDCSGFTKTIYFLNGMIIPRDASQQVHTGKPIDSVQHFENLQKGDLLFFGRKATDSTNEKVVHVGMWIGNNEFIHSSDRVRISSMDPNADNYDDYNRQRYLRTKRILREKGEALISLSETPLFKD
ncbi:C40 family peptidase [Pareuzebyella sediminis]|uniref:C40 family peptidase n=1 Tax=Pareuzebyella sediminis TaxID=2607998 RepID=UPI0011F00CFD|nr:C40 family peptidase [Pareuzebyella sediminis]